MKDRYLLVDGVRGLAIVNMVLYHFLYDVFMIYGKDPGWIALPPVHIWQQFICWTFIFIAGFSWRFGLKHDLRRGLFINLCGFAITLVTLIATPTEAVWFGILNFIGCAILLLLPLHRPLERVPGTVGMALSFALFLVFKNVQSGILSLGGLKLLELPRFLYNSKLLTPFGFPYPGFRSSDYFPLLPWFFLFLTGYFFCSLFLKREGWKGLFRRPIPLLTAIGQKSLWIYLIHQPVCMLLCMLLFG